MTAIAIHANSALRGVLLAGGGALAFSVNDMAIKFLSGDYALHQIMLIRSLIAFSIVICVILASGHSLGVMIPRRWGAQMLRAGVIILSNICYYSGLAVMPLADAAAVAYVSPLFLTVLSVMFLHEKVGPRRWTAVCIGFVGTIIMLRPGVGIIQPAALLVLICAALYAVGNMMSRSIRATETSFSLTATVQIAFILSACTMGLIFGDGHAYSPDSLFAFMLRAWTWPMGGDWIWLAVTGISTALGAMMLARAFATTEAALIAPLEYAGMPMAILWGALFFKTWPDLQAWVGILLICGPGLYIIWRETKAKQDLS